MSTNPAELDAAAFAAKIRSKYPSSYDDMPDDVLTKSVLTKYPTYNDLVQPALRVASSYNPFPFGRLEESKSWKERYLPETADSFNVSQSAPTIRDAYRQQFKADLPLRIGQGNVHNQPGYDYDHRNAGDVGINPLSTQGKWLRQYLEQNNIPYQAFTRAQAGVATGPHIHIGKPSHKTSQRYPVGTTLQPPDATLATQTVPPAPATNTGADAGLPAPTLEEPSATPPVTDGLQQEGQPATTTPQPPAIRTPPMDVSIPEPPTPVSIPPFNKEMAGAYGTIMRKFSPAGIEAYHRFVKENYRPQKGAKPETVEQAAEDEGMASLFLKIQERLASDPTLTGKGRKVGQRQARALAEVGMEWLKDPAQKDSQLPPVLHAALIQSKMSPEEEQGLPSLLRGQRAKYAAGRAQLRARVSESQRALKSARAGSLDKLLFVQPGEKVTPPSQEDVAGKEQELTRNRQLLRDYLGVHQSSLFERPQMSAVQKTVADMRSNIVQQSIAGYRQSKTTKSLTDELANLTNQQGPVGAEEKTGRENRIRVVQSELQKTLPTGAYIPGIGTNLSPSARVNLKNLGLTDKEINKLAAAPPTHPFDVRGITQGLQYYDPDKDQVRASLPNDAAKEEYDNAVSASRYDWVIRNTWSQLGGHSKAALMRSLANTAAIQIENIKSSNGDVPAWLTKFEADVRGQADAVSKGLERADDVARDVFGGFDPMRNSVTAGPTMATRFIAQSLPALGEFLLAEKLGARSGQPGYAMGAYGALTTPEFSRQGVEQSVESASTYEKLGGSVFANLHKAGKIGGGILTGATIYAMARGEGASPEDALRAGFIFGFGHMLHSQGELKRTIETGKKILEVAPEAARDVAGRLKTIATGETGGYKVGEEITYKSEDGTVRTGTVQRPVGSDARHGVVSDLGDGTAEFVPFGNILGKQKQLAGEVAPAEESAPSPKFDETGAKIVGAGKAEDVKPAPKVRVGAESPLYKSLRQLDESNRANEAENVKLFTEKARTQGATPEMIDETLGVDDARREAFFESLKNIKPKESGDVEQEIQSTRGQADQRDQGSVATSGSAATGSGASGIRPRSQSREGASESAAPSAIEEGSKASNVPSASTPEVALSEASGRESSVSDKLPKEDVTPSERAKQPPRTFDTARARPMEIDPEESNKYVGGYIRVLKESPNRGLSGLELVPDSDGRAGWIYPNPDYVFSTQASMLFGREASRQFDADPHSVAPVRVVKNDKGLWETEDKTLSPKQSQRQEEQTKNETEKNAASTEVVPPPSGASVQAGTGREASALDAREGQRLAETATSQPAPETPDSPPVVSENELNYGTLEKPHVPNLGTAYAKHFTAGNRFKNIVEARKFAGSLLKGDVKPGTLAAKQVDEAVELGSVHAAREIVRSGGSEKEIYKRLVDLYDRQPNLSMKTSTSVANQAYSTPLPLAYVASRLAGIDKDTTVYEPSAGNGALLVEANLNKTSANEKDSQRHDNLSSLGDYEEISRTDATTHRPIAGKRDVVIANPPFGAVKENDVSKSFQVRPHYRTNEIDHAIALKALEAMKDNGRAVLIVGGVKAETTEGRSEGYNSKAKRAFYKTLYDEYNVADHFTVAGDLYSKQGAAWPVDVIVIHGRGKSKLSLPAAEVPRTYTSFDQLAEVLNAPSRTNLLDAGQSLGDRADVGRRGSSEGAAPDDGHLLDATQSPSADIDREGESGRRASLDDTRPPERDESVERATVGLAGELGRGVDLAESGDARTVADDGRTGQVATSSDNEVNAESAASVRDRDAGELSNRAPDAAREPASIEEPAPRVEAQKREREKIATTSQQAPYSPVSRATPVGTFVPVNMKTATDDALDHLADKVGDLDHFVAHELGYEPKDIPRYYSAEQVDAAAGAIQAMKDGSGYIIGDQGGIGKGRVVGAIIKWAHNTGRRAIFVTEKPNLYKDIVRDLVDINHGSMDEWATRALITNSSERIPLDDDETIILRSLPNHNARLQEMIAKDDMGDYDTVFTTYSQMQTIKGGQRTVRQDFLQQFAPGSIVIFDESHNAGGTESSKPTQNLDRATFARQIAAQADGVFYSSATYAKRPSVMSLYFKTDMRKAVPSMADLPEAIAKGGVPLQQVTAAMLTEAGQHIRRERNFAGLVYDTNVVPVDKRAAESVSEVMRNVKRFDELKVAAVEALAKEAKKDAKAVMADGSTGAAGASSTNFTSIMHNLIDQMLLTLKVDEAVSRALQSLDRGEKAVVTVANTMGSFIAHYVEDNGLHPGDAIGLNFGDMLRRYMERSREVRISNAFGDTQRRYLTDDELGEQATHLYKNTLKHIEQQDWSGMPVSPIDFIKQKLAAKGYKMGEITGRQHTIDYSGEMPVYRMRPAKETSIAGRTRTLTEFNSGKLDALIINQAGSTGLSIHASAKFKDQRKRHMIIAQAERNIDTHMQMLYRVDRTGQVVKPSYEQLGADIPAEKRPMAVLSKKMASLNASTTASKESATKSKDTPDWMNDYGDEVVAALMEDNPDVHAALGRPLKDNQVGDGLAREGAIRKVTGRIPLLTIKDQEALYDMIESEYADMIERLDAMGENALEAKSLDLDAKPISQTEIFKGTEGDPSPFAKGAYAEEMDVKRIGKPYTSEQVTDLLARNLDLPEGRAKTLENLQEAGQEKKQARMKDVRERYQAYKTSVLDDIEDPQKMRAKETQLDGVAQRLNSIFKGIHEGETVQLEMSGGKFYGVVLNIEQKGQPKNPVALGSWKVTFAVSDAMKQITLPASRFHMERDVNDKSELLGMGHVIVSPEAYAKTLAHGKVPILEAFDKAQSVSRETRTIVTGNILAGFGKIPKGQIINFTDHEGSVRQGVLTPRDFDLQQTLADEAVHFTEPKHILDFLTQANGLVSTKDQGLRVSNQHGSFRFSTAASKSAGGIYFLNRDLIDAAGQDFVKSGQYMILNLPRERAEQVLRAAMEQGIEFQTQTYKDVARKITGNVVPQAETASQAARFGPGAANVGDVPEESAMRQLMQAMKGNAGRITLRERLGLAAQALKRIPQKTDKTFSALSQTSNATAAALWEWYAHLPQYTTEKRARGDRELALQTANAERSELIKQSKRDVPRPIDREAIQDWLDAGGRQNQLEDWTNRSTTEYKAGYARSTQLTDEQQAMATNIASLYEAYKDEALDEGILRGVIEDYANRRWAGMNAGVNRVTNEIANSKLAPNFRNARQRMIEHSFDGEEAGMKHVTKDAFVLLADYQQGLKQAIADRAYIRALTRLKAEDGRPYLVPSGAGSPVGPDDAIMVRPNARRRQRVAGVPEKVSTADYVSVNHPALSKWVWLGEFDGKEIYLRGQLVVHPSFAKDLKNMIGRNVMRDSRAARFLFGANRLIKTGRFALPFFHAMTEGLHATFHGVNPFLPPEIDWQNREIKDGVRHGLMLAADRNALEEFKEGIAAGSLISKVPVAGQILTPLSEWMFESYIPRLKAMTYQVINRRNLKRYAKQIRTGRITRDQVAELSARQANNAYGELNYRYMARSPLMQDVLRMTLQSPDFTEARFKTVVDALKPYGREQLRALLTMLGIAYFGARILNKIFDNDYHWDAPFTLVIKGREYGPRLIVGDIKHALESFREFLVYRLSPMASLAVNALSGRDAQGKKVTMSEAALDELKSAVPFGLRRSLTDEWWMTTLNAFGISAHKHYTKAEKVLNEYIGDHVPDSVEALSEQAKVRRELLSKRQEKDITGDVQAAYNAGKIDEKTARELLRDEKLSRTAFKLKHVPIKTALDAYEQMSDVERTPDVKLAMVDKFARNFKDLTLEDKERIKQLGFRVPRRFSPGQDDEPPAEPVDDRELKRQQAERERKAAREFAPGQELPTQARPTLQKKQTGGFFYHVHPRQ